MLNNAQKAYEESTKATTSSRELEAAALFKTARLLEACQREWHNPGAEARFEEALRKNLRLWTLFQSELARPDHELPANLRVDLLRISAFVDRRTFELMSHPDPEKMQALININRQIATGLSETPPNP